MSNVPNGNLSAPMTPTEAQPVSGTAPGVAPTLPTIVSVQGVAGGTPVDVNATVPGTVDVSDRPARQLGIVGIDGQPISVDATGSIVAVSNFPATQPISAAALPLPAGAATEATLATRLADATFTGRINTQGQKAMAASTPVVLASDQSYPPAAGLRTLQAAGNFTTTRLSASQDVDGYRGLFLYLQILVNPGGGQTLTVAIETSGGFRLVNFPATLATFTHYMTYPGITAADFAGTAARTIPVPTQWNSLIIPSGAGVWSAVLNYRPII